MNPLEQIDLLVRPAKVLDEIVGSSGARDARDKIIFLVNSDLDPLIDPDSEEALGDPIPATSADDLRVAVRELLKRLDPEGLFFSWNTDNRDQLAINWKAKSGTG